MVARIYQNENLEVDMVSYTKLNFPYSYQKDIELSKILSKITLNTEIGYLALHIERITQYIIQNNE